jgi:integrase
MQPIEPKLSTYWARHTWATIAAELDIPKETIAAGLGHNIGSPITSIYIDFNMKKVDEANRKIIDYIYNKV